MANILKTLFGRNPSYYINISDAETPSIAGLSARQMYATQENLYAVISFLAESIAQLPLKVYRREKDDTRTRDRDSDAAKLLYRPNKDQTSFDFWEAVATELLLMGVATIWVLPDSESESGKQLRIIPQEWIVKTNKETNYAADSIRVTSGTGSYIDISREAFTQFKFYAPGNPGGYQTPISALRQTLNEQVNADRFRAKVWKTSGRFNAYITRPQNVQPWSEAEREKWIKTFREAWGAGGANEGKMPILEDGMEIKPYQFNAKEAQYAETKQLSREDVAAAYHVNPNLIWHKGSQTYASAKDNARALYAECLGPTLQKLQQRINAFLLPMIGADASTYVEFDLKEKLKGSFEERASILQAAVGGPWMTRNEARADNNMPAIEGGNELIVPLNVITGGQASPQDTHMNSTSRKHEVKAKEEIRIKGKAEDDEAEELEKIIRKFIERQRNSVLPKIGAGQEDWFDSERWNKELADDLEPIFKRIADRHGQAAADTLKEKYNKEITRAYLRATAEWRAKALNDKTVEDLSAAIEADEDVAETYERRVKESNMYGQSIATAIAGWAIIEAGNQALNEGLEKEVLKEWVTGPNPRPSHAAMNGERVPLDEPFSNGAMWPGDDNLDADESCGCNCHTDVIAITK